MSAYQFVYGPVPSRRMGLSLGISPIPKKVCNYSCVYCQLGRTRGMTNERRSFYQVEALVKEFRDYIKKGGVFDIVTLVGEGEPTLFADIHNLIKELKKNTAKPIAVITNGALLYEEEVKAGLKEADLVLPSLDAYDEETFRKINRPYGTIRFKDVFRGLKEFSHEYEGELWIETMLVKGINDSEEGLQKIKELLAEVSYDRLFINSPVRPPAEKWVEQSSEATMRKAGELLGGTLINVLASEGFASRVEDHYEAVLSIIGRHPMNQHEVRSFLNSRSCDNIEEIFKSLAQDDGVETVDYKGYKTFRLKY